MQELRIHPFLTGIPNNYFKASPLIQCITNEITCESMANALLYVNSKPIMADDPREFDELFRQTGGLVLNLGHLSIERETQLLTASQYAVVTNKPVVVDAVGVSATTLRKELALKLLDNHPTVMKGNASEMRSLCGLVSRGRGVDGHVSDQTKEALSELGEQLKLLSYDYPETSFLATGKIDVVASRGCVWYLDNGVPYLDQITGTGDIVGALIASLLSQTNTDSDAVIGAVSYFNICGERALANCSTPVGMEAFRYHLFNELSYVYDTIPWWDDVRGEVR